MDKKMHFVHTLIKRQDRRDGFRVNENTVICKNISAKRIYTKQLVGSEAQPERR